MKLFIMILLIYSILDLAISVSNEKSARQAVKSLIENWIIIIVVAGFGCIIYFICGGKLDGFAKY
jgi:hypothetical protein